MTGYSLERLGGMLKDALTDQEASELYRKYFKLPESELTGDLDTGFRYWVTTPTDAGTVLKLVRCTVTPVAASDAMTKPTSPGS